ncbi:hypothetical protein DPMN_154728 [Dreissena polymorpha]|uniref:Uncharacterized protein n=1 Tax=Dreissena polymorpha TaxID=45954 RepID=A0A9D4FLK6_DREPO|nr:hypothetical protein DPMN_154728 [Dreissena polymorpha]
MTIISIHKQHLITVFHITVYRASHTTVTNCAVSPDGARIYVANAASKQLLTLFRDGQVISTLTDPALDWGHVLYFKNYHPPGIHVTDSKQVLVCGENSHTIIQVDKDGRQTLAEVVAAKDGEDGVTCPSSVYYSKRTGTLIVGMWRIKDIIVFKAKLKTL